MTTQPFVFERWTDRSQTPVAGELTIAALQKHLPRTDPLPMHPSWYANYDPQIDVAFHESYRPDVDRLRGLLQAELSLAKPNFTGRNVACVLTTDEGIYSGHVEELGIGNFTSAVSMALGKLEEAEEAGAKLTGVYVMGTNVKKPKYVMPIPEDYDRLAEHFTDDWGPTFIIVSPDSNDYTSVWASVHGPAYSVKKPSDFRDFIANDEYLTIFPFLIQERTILSYEDAEFVARLMAVGRQLGIGIYLTGSASGRGEISNALKATYDDIDLLIVTGDKDPAQVEAILKAISEEYFGPLQALPLTSYNYNTGESFPGTFLYDAAGNRKVQLQIGPTMESINYRPGNMARNFFHRVS